MYFHRILIACIHFITICLYGWIYYINSSRQLEPSLSISFSEFSIFKISKIFITIGVFLWWISSYLCILIPHLLIFISNPLNLTQDPFDAKLVKNNRILYGICFVCSLISTLIGFTFLNAFLLKEPTKPANFDYNAVVFGSVTPTITSILIFVSIFIYILRFNRPISVDSSDFKTIETGNQTDIPFV